MKTLNVLLSAALLSVNAGVVSSAQEKEADGTARVIADDENDQSSVDVNVEADEVVTDDNKAGEVSVSDGTRSYSIEFESSSQSSEEEDGKPKVKVGGKVTVVGPDGEKKVYDLSGKDGKAFRLHLDGDDDQVRKSLHDVLIFKSGGNQGEEDQEAVAAAEEERYMIGVQCDEADDVLRSHLHLGDTGLVVMEVRDDTPAEEAGLIKNDIIVQINDKDLESRDDLIDSVVSSEGKVLTLSVIREGEKLSISVEPRKIKVPVIVAPAGAEDDAEVNPGHGFPGMESLPEGVRKHLKERKGSVRLHRVHPGVMIEGEMPHDKESINRMIERIRKSAGDEAAKALAEAHEFQNDARIAKRDADQFSREQTKQLDETLHSLRQQMDAMKAQIDALQKQLEDKNSDKE